MANLLGGRAVAEPRVEEAALAASRGETEKARALLGTRPSTDDAALVLACVELESGAFDKAEKLLAALRGAHPGSADIGLASALVAERRARPTEPWRATFVRAMKSLHVGDDNDHLLGFELTSRRPISDSELAKLPEGDRFLIRAAQGASTPSEALIKEALARADKAAPLHVQLASVAILGSKRLPETVKARAELSRRALLQKIASANPGSAYLQAWAAVDGVPDAAFSDEDIARIERALAAKERSCPMPLLYGALKRAYSGADAAQAWEASFSGLFAFYPTPMHVLLSQRATVTARAASPEARARIASLLEQAARLFLDQASILGLGVGRSLLAKAADLSSSQALAQEAAARLREFGDLTKASKRASTAASLPLTLLNRELTDAKITESAGCTETSSRSPVGEPMGASCEHFFCRAWVAL